MVSTSKPTHPDPAPLPRAIEANGALRVPRDRALARAASGAGVLTRQFGVAASHQQGADPDARVAVPHGVWPRTPQDEADEADAAALRTLEPALANYATSLRAQRGPRQEPARRGIPVLARRRGAAEAGETRGPGGLARACVPTDHESPAIDAVRAARAVPDAAPGARAPRRGPAPAAPTAPGAPTGERRPAIQLRPRRRGPS